MRGGKEEKFLFSLAKKSTTKYTNIHLLLFRGEHIALIKDINSIYEITSYTPRSLLMLHLS